jgi:hypothetical protein
MRPFCFCCWARRKLRKEDATPWDELLVANSVYVKGGAGGETQGTGGYQC